MGSLLLCELLNALYHPPKADATLQKSIKSKCLAPCIGCLLKKGIIIFTISLWFDT